MGDEFPLHGIHVHVLEFFDELRVTPDVEIVKAGLPELRQEIVRVSKRKSELLGGYFLGWLAADSPRHALLQDLHDGWRSALCWLADEQVNVVGHDDVARDREPVAVAHLSQNLHKQILRAR